MSLAGQATVAIAGRISFLQSAAALKGTLRTGRTASGREESVADHCWRLCLMVLLFEDRLVGVDLARLLKLCLIHDLGEAISGDVPATEQAGDPHRSLRERADLNSLCEPLPPADRDAILALWDEYAEASSREGRLAKGFDKLETMLQHLAGSNPPGFDWGFNLDYGRKWTDADPLLKAIRALVDDQTRERLEPLHR